MEFTLQQLTAENLGMIFEQAFIDVVKVIPAEKDEDGSIKFWGSVFVKDDGWVYRIMPANDAEFIAFSLSMPFEANDLPPAEIIYKISNYFDTYPVHCHYGGTDADGDHEIRMIYNQIFPDGMTGEARDIIKIFKVFQKLAIGNLRKINQVGEFMQRDQK